MQNYEWQYLYDKLDDLISELQDLAEEFEVGGKEKVFQELDSIAEKLREIVRNKL